MEQLLPPDTKWWTCTGAKEPLNDDAAARRFISYDLAKPGGGMSSMLEARAVPGGGLEITQVWYDEASDIPVIQWEQFAQATNKFIRPGWKLRKAINRAIREAHETDHRG